MKQRNIRAILVVVALVAAAVPLAAQETFTATFKGYNEIPTIFSTGSGTFTMTLSPEETSLDFVMTYEGLQTAISAAHIHVGERWVNGPVVIFLCGGGGRPACPQEGGTVEGTIDASHVGAGAAMLGFEAGNLAKMIDAFRNGATYANIHTMTRPGGEIRGQIVPYAK